MRYCIDPGPQGSHCAPPPCLSMITSLQSRPNTYIISTPPGYICPAGQQAVTHQNAQDVLSHEGSAVPAPVLRGATAPHPSIVHEQHARDAVPPGQQQLLQLRLPALQRGPEACSTRSLSC